MRSRELCMSIRCFSFDDYTIELADFWCDPILHHADRDISVAIKHADGIYHGRGVRIVHPRVAQAAMRHSRIELTTNFYTDPALLDVNGAVNALPDFAGRQIA